jgi:hypothetical protein
MQLEGYGGAPGGTVRPALRRGSSGSRKVRVVKKELRKN